MRGVGAGVGAAGAGGLSTQAPEVVAAAPARSASALRSQFAEHEQNLVGVVLAALQGDVESETVQQSLAVPAEVDLVHLGHSLHDFWCLAAYPGQWCAGCDPAVRNNAADLAVRMARAALCIKQAWPAAVVSMAMGRGAVHGQVAVGEVVDWRRSDRGQRGSRSNRARHPRSTPMRSAPSFLSGRFVLSLRQRRDDSGRRKREPMPVVRCWASRRLAWDATLSCACSTCG